LGKVCRQTEDLLRSVVLRDSMMSPGVSTGNVKRTVVVHRGARDGYQVAAALAEAGLLERLVTDLYWPADCPWASKLVLQAGGSIRQMLLARYSPSLPSSLVTQTLFCGLISHFLDKSSKSPFSWRRRATRWTDRVMGHTAGDKAFKTNSHLLSYSYYGYHAFSTFNRPGILFQAHPHPISVRRILRRELESNPDCSESLLKEWELSLPQEDFGRLVEETRMAACILTASSFTRQTLLENGIDASTIHVAPYGIDRTRFSLAPAEIRRSTSGKLKLLFVGTISQRKGIKYLLEALRLVGNDVELTVCGRVVDDLSLFKPFGSQVTVQPSVSAAELLKAYRAADLFVFPSVVEGFGQVLLESLACGLPVLTTTRTAAPDLIRPGIEGFIVEPCRPDALAERIEWALANRRQLSDMRQEASRTAAAFTWIRFRKTIVDIVRAFQATQEADARVVSQYA
jgi:glycosyltransferase involved in cell wall biosynthesis